MHEINDRVRQLFTSPGSASSLIDAVYACPWHPKGNVPEFTREHHWRKPQPGMILAAAGDLGLDLSRSWLIGDADRDIQAGIAAGLSPDRCLMITGGTTVLDAARRVIAGHGLHPERIER
jgi:D-glycero-D-manno-heptose 1,7-bisphosphate phosphatase